MPDRPGRIFGASKALVHKIRRSTDFEDLKFEKWRSGCSLKTGWWTVFYKPIILGWVDWEGGNCTILGKSGGQKLCLVQNTLIGGFQSSKILKGLDGFRASKPPKSSLSFVLFFLQISKWVKTGDLSRLEHAVYMGKGSFTKGKTAWNEETRAFLKTVPNIQVKYAHLPGGLSTIGLSPGVYSSNKLRKKHFRGIFSVIVN